MLWLDDVDMSQWNEPSSISDINFVDQIKWDDLPQTVWTASSGNMYPNIKKLWQQ